MKPGELTKFSEEKLKLTFIKAVRSTKVAAKKPVKKVKKKPVKKKKNAAKK